MILDLFKTYNKIGTKMLLNFFFHTKLRFLLKAARDFFFF